MLSVMTTMKSHGGPITIFNMIASPLGGKSDESLPALFALARDGLTMQIGLSVFYLLGQIVRFANLVDLSQLRLEPIDMRFFTRQNVHEQILGAVVGIVSA